MAQNPNFLFIFSDEHSFRFMGHRSEEDGGEKVDTPNFDRLAGQGTVFTDAYCQMPLCTPSRLSMLTGREVRGAGAWGNGSVMKPDAPTMASALGGAGYETCLLGKMHLGGSRQFAGFRHRPYGDLTGRTGHQRDPIQGGGGGMRGRTTYSVGVTEIPESLFQEQVSAQESIAFLREHEAANPDQPWFLMASLSRPHFPLTAPRRWVERYPPDAVSEPKVGRTGDAYDHPMSVGMRKGFRADEIEHDEMMRARGSYFACVSYLDELLGDMFIRLEATGQLDNTIIIYTTDHGEMAGEHGVWWKNSWHEASARVPLIISTPMQRRGEQPAQEVRTPAALVDLFPTMCGLAGVSAPEGLDGVDLSDVVSGSGSAPDRPVFTDALAGRWGPGTEFRMVRQGIWKYVHFRNAPALFFNLENDPHEQRNLITRGCEGGDAEALRRLKRTAEETMDFDAAAEERRRDQRLKQRFPLKTPNSQGNLYTLPNGKIVNADDALYNPTVIAEDAVEAFSDHPDRDD